MMHWCRQCCLWWREKTSLQWRSPATSNRVYLRWYFDLKPPVKCLIVTIFRCRRSHLISHLSTCLTGFILVQSYILKLIHASNHGSHSFWKKHTCDLASCSRGLTTLLCSMLSYFKTKVKQRQIASRKQRGMSKDWLDPHLVDEVKVENCI